MARHHMGFTENEDGTWTNEDGVNVWKYDDSNEWGFDADVLGAKIEHDGWKHYASAMLGVKRLVPNDKQARELVRETFDSMSDPERLALVQELDYDHGHCFEWSEVMPLADFLESLSRDELVRVAVYGDLHNEIDPVRYDKYGDAEQVSYEGLYSEVCENEDEILDVLIGVLEQGLSIYSTNYFDQLGDAISDGTWRDWINSDELYEGQEVRVCGKG